MAHPLANTYPEVVEFPSHDDAMRNSELPETSSFAERITKLCDTSPKFINLDVTREDPL